MAEGDQMKDGFEANLQHRDRAHSRHIEVAAAHRRKDAPLPTPQIWLSLPAASSERKTSIRELEVLQLLTEGFSNEEIGERLHVSASAVASRIKVLLAEAWSAQPYPRGRDRVPTRPCHLRGAHKLSTQERSTGRDAATDQIHVIHAKKGRPHLKAAGSGDWAVTGCEPSSAHHESVWIGANGLSMRVAVSQIDHHTRLDVRYTVRALESGGLPHLGVLTGTGEAAVRAVATHCLAGAPPSSVMVTPPEAFQRTWAGPRRSGPCPTRCPSRPQRCGMHAVRYAPTYRGGANVNAFLAATTITGIDEFGAERAHPDHERHGEADVHCHPMLEAWTCEGAGELRQPARQGHRNASLLTSRHPTRVDGGVQRSRVR